MKAWREAEELERKLGTILAAWRSSFQNANRLGGYASPSRVPNFDARWVDQVHRYWLRLEFVQNAGSTERISISAATRRRSSPRC